MNYGDIILILLLSALAAWAVIACIRSKKKAPCSCCGMKGSCCKHCHSDKADDKH